MATSTADFLGLGRYSPAEAARFARVRTEKLSRWLFGAGKAKPVFEPQFGRDQEKRVVTFLDFAQALSIHDIRLNVGVPLYKIREAYVRAQKEFGISHPFAVKHGVFVFGDLNEPENCELGIYLRKGLALPPKEAIEMAASQLTGPNHGHQLIADIIQPFSRKLQFSQSGEANLYVAHENYGLRVVMDPDIRFGKPHIEGVGYEAETLASAAITEGGEDRAARLYDVDITVVRVALEFQKTLLTPPPPQKPKNVAA